MPFCPKCRREYREGIKSCHYCGVELAAELPEGADQPQISRAKRISKYGRPARMFNSAQSVPFSADDPLFTVREYNYPSEALAEQAKLAAHGIKGFLEDEHMIAVNLQHLAAHGSIKLQVKTSEAKTAAGILDTPEKPPENKEKTNPVCPQCNSTAVAKTSSLFGNKWKCSGCGYQWKPGKEDNSSHA